MSPVRSQAAIRFIVALFLAQTFVNAVAVPHPHIHKVLDPRQVVSLPVVERQEPENPETKNVFDAIIDTLESYNGWQVFQDFFRKLFNGSPPNIGDGDDKDGSYNVPPVVVVPGPAASESPVDVISVIESIISEVATATGPVVAVPTDLPTISESDPIMSILPIGDLSTAIELFPTGEPSIPTELLPESTDLPIVIVVPPVETNTTDIDVELPTGVALPTDFLPPLVTAPIVTAPIVTGPIIVLPLPTVSPLFPIENVTVVAPSSPSGPIVIIVPTDLSIALPEISASIGVSADLNATASLTAIEILPTEVSVPEISATIGVSADLNVTAGLTSVINITATIEPTLLISSAGTALPVTLSVEVPFANVTAVIPTLVLPTISIGTDAVGSILPSISIDTISAPYSNATASAAISLIGTGDLTAVLPIETTLPEFPNITEIVVPTLSGTGDLTAVLPIETTLPQFPNDTVIVVPTLTGTGDLTAVLPIETTLPQFPNITEIVVPTLSGTGDLTAVLPIETTLPQFPNDTVIVVPNDTVIVVPTLIVTGDLTAVLPIETTLPQFPNSTDIVLPTLLPGTGALPLPSVSALPLPSIATDGPYLNTTVEIPIILPTLELPTLTLPTLILSTGVPSVSSAEAPAGTIIVVPGGPDVVFPNITITVNASDVTLPVTLPLLTQLPTDIVEASVSAEISVAPIATALPINATLPALPIETAIPVNVTLPPVSIETSLAINATLPPVETDLPVILPVDVPTLNVTLPIVPIETALPVNVTLAPVVPIPTEFPTIPVVTLPIDPSVEIPEDAPVVEFPGLLALRSICRDPTVHQLTLPILNRFYGPSAYPALFSFPGCLPSNDRQATQAPGLLNCTALGHEVQTCQASGRRVLLSVKADSAIAVGGGVSFGDPATGAPWGGYTANGSIPLGVYFPNLFDERHVPSALAQTLFSLFGEGTTERADLRPLGPDTPPEDGISWVTRPLGEEVVVDGFDVQVPQAWRGSYQEGKFNDFVQRLRELNDQAWTASGGVKAGPNDLGRDGKGVVYQGWNAKRAVQRIMMVGEFEVVVE